MKFAHLLGRASWTAKCFVALALVGLSQAHEQSNRLEKPVDFSHYETIELAEFRSSPGAPWTQVALPHTWERGEQPSSTEGEYRLKIALQDSLDEEDGLAIRGARISTERRVYLNGQVISTLDADIGGNEIGLPRPMPTLIELPGSLLHAGQNELLIHMDCAARCGMGEIEFGATPVIQRRHLHYEAVWITAPQIIVTSTVGLALFMLLIWWMRPSESAIGVLGLMWIPTFLRCYSQLVAQSTLPATALEAGFITTNIASSVLYSVFAHILIQRKSPRFRRLMWGVLIAAPMIGLISGFTEQSPQTRNIAYPLLLMLNIHTLWILVREYKAGRRLIVGALALSTVLLLGAATHDVLYFKGWFSIYDFSWFTWISPLFFLGFSTYLLRNMAGALDRAEELNIDLERRVSERTSDLQIVVKAQTQFIASASHDLRQPLHTAGLLMARLRERMSDDGNMELLSQARAALNSMENLLHGILDISRLDAGLDRPHIEAFSLKPLWSNIERTFVPEAIRLSLQLRLHPTDFWVASDMHLLQRVLNNLVGNALRYTSKGGVLVSARLRGDDILIQVWDTGVGIPREMQDKVFQEFFQLNNPQRDRNKGLGLGLAIVRRTLALLEHRVLLKSSPGRGSVFSVTVPRVILPSIAPALAVRTPPPDVSGLFILLVDDQESVLYAMQGLLKDWGCSVIVAQNGKVAQSALEESLREPDAMILDYRLENENGLQIAQSLHDLMGHPAPVLIVTGDIASGPILEITNSGFDVMHKPVDIYELRIWLGRIRTNLVASGEVISGFGT